MALRQIIVITSNAAATITTTSIAITTTTTAIIITTTNTTITIMTTTITTTSFTTISTNTYYKINNKGWRNTKSTKLNKIRTELIYYISKYY